MPTLSVITVTLNARHSIEDTLRSIQSQKSDDVEYLVVDGCSTDGTSEILKKYVSIIDVFISEPDSGLYDAMNKGIDASSGRYFCFLNAGDWYTEGALTTVVEKLRNDAPDILYGNLVYVESDGRVCRLWKPGIFQDRKLRKLWIPPHEATFINMALVEKVGKMDLRFKVAADYNFLLSAFSSARRTTYVNTVLVAMKTGGTATKSLKNILRGNMEISSAYRRQFNKLPKSIIVRKIVRQVQQRWAALGYHSGYCNPPKY